CERHRVRHFSQLASFLGRCVTPILLRRKWIVEQRRQGRSKYSSQMTRIAFVAFYRMSSETFVKRVLMFWPQRTVWIVLETRSNALQSASGRMHFPARTLVNWYQSSRANRIRRRKMKHALPMWL